MTNYVYDQYGQFNSENINELEETFEEDIKELAKKFAALVVEKEYDRYQLDRYVKNELESAIIFEINTKKKG